MIKIFRAGTACFKVTIKSRKPKTKKGRERFTVAVHMMGKRFRRGWNMGSAYTQYVEFVAKLKG